MSGASEAIYSAVLYRMCNDAFNSILYLAVHL